MRRSTSNPTELDQKSMKESMKVQKSVDEVLAQSKRTRISLLSRRDEGTKTLNCKLSMVLQGLAVPPHASMGRCGKTLLCRLAKLATTEFC